MRKRLRQWFYRQPTLEHAWSHWKTLRLAKTHPYGEVPPAPKRVVVEPTNGCNLKCTYCGNPNMARPVTYMPLPLYTRLLDEMVELGIPRLTLHTIGEPTLHPQIARMVELATERRRVVTLSTNGTTMRPELARALVAAAPEIVNFSADAGDQATLEKTRIGLELDVLLEGMRTLKRERDANGPLRESPWGVVRLPTITLTTVRTKEFTREVERRYFEVFTPLVDDFLFHTPNSHGDYVPDDSYVHEGPFGLLPRRIRHWLYKKIRMACHYPWDSLYLLSDGTMSVCRWDFDARVDVGRFGEHSIQALWTSERMMKLRRAHMTFDFRDWSTCEDCTGTFYENRAVHHAVTRKLMQRNGVVPTRDAWLPENPYGVRKRARQVGLASA